MKITLIFFLICRTDEEVIKKFLYSAVTEEEVDHLFIARRRPNKTRGFGFITVKTQEAFDVCLFRPFRSLLISSVHNILTTLIAEIIKVGQNRSRR